MQLNPTRLVLSVCLGAALAVTGLAGCKSHGERSEGRYKDDQKTSSNVKKDLKDAPVYKYPGVQVTTFDGVVQLSGFVDTVDQKNSASQVARHTDGVREVINSLVVKPQVAEAGPAPVINNENRITTSPTGSPTGHRTDSHHGGTTSSTAVITPAGPATTTTVPANPSEQKATTETKAPSETQGETINAPNVIIKTPHVDINTNSPANP